MAMTEEIVNLPDGDHEHVRRYFDETGEISYETYRLKKRDFPRDLHRIGMRRQRNTAM